MAHNDWRRFRLRGAIRRYWRRGSFTIQRKNPLLEGLGFVPCKESERMVITHPLPNFHFNGVMTCARDEHGHDWWKQGRIDLKCFDFFELIPEDRYPGIKSALALRAGRAAFIPRRLYLKNE
jgi:hypothetical protein